MPKNKQIIKHFHRTADMLFESLAYLFLGKYVVQLLYALKSNYLMCVFDGDRALELLCSCGN